jgi:hypothetical protein
VAQNYFTPSYAVETRDGQGNVVAQSTLPEGKNDHPRVEGSALYQEALNDLKAKYLEIRNHREPERRAVIDDVEADIDAQRIQAQQHYLAKDHPLHVTPTPHPHDKPAQQHARPIQAPPPAVEPKTTTTPAAAQDQPLAASITLQSSVGDRFSALADAIKRGDDKANDRVIEAHQASPEWQKFQQQSMEHEQAQIAQQQREREQQVVAQRLEEAQQPQQRWPAMGR